MAHNRWKSEMIYVLVLLASLLLLSPSSSADEQVVFTQSANGTRNTRPFTVKDRWELQWETKGERLAIFLFTSEGEPRGMLPIVTQDKPGSDRSYYPKGGAYYLKIVTNSDWTITVVQLP